MRALRSESEIISSWKGKPAEPLVSVMCLAYNHEKYIEDALNGFLIQETDFPFEVLIHDDASTDRTADIIREFEAAYPNIIKPVYQSENQWSKDKKVIREAQYGRVKGKYLAYCEGDDYWTDRNKLQQQIDTLEKNPQYSMCFHNALILWEGKPNKKRIFCLHKNSVYNTVDLIEKGWFIPTQSIVHRKDYFEHKEWMDYVLGGDYALQLLLSTKGDIVYLDEIMSVYRKNITSYMNPIYPSLRTLETLVLFNYYTEFKYDSVIKERILHMPDKLYIALLASRKGVAKYLNIDLYLKYANFSKFKLIDFYNKLTNK
jgi:glycosyltransferase involved in cell wall biosynthesis